jgi:hypothetical protein
VPIREIRGFRFLKFDCALENENEYENEDEGSEAAACGGGEYTPD